QFDARGIRLRPNGDRLRVEAPAGVLTDADRAAITAHKAELLTALSARSAGACMVIEDRAAIFRRQIETYWAQLDESWVEVIHRPIPPLSLPGVVVSAGGCQLCGDPLKPGRTYRCAPCVDAMNLVLERLKSQ